MQAMKKMKFSVLVAILMSSIGMVANPIKRAPQMDPYQYVDDIFYYCDESTHQATILDIYEEIEEYYTQSVLRIEPYLVFSGSGVSTGGATGEYSKTYAIYGIGTKAFRNAAASSIVFVEPCQVGTIGTLAFSSMANMTGKLTLPASLEHLDVSSILLPGITEIEFLGEVPPSCDIAGGYNPWTSATEVTSADIKITVPDGALSAYQDAEGIGDYFTCLKKQPGPGTALEENAEAVAPQQKKVLRNGRLYILRDGVVYDAQGQKVK